MSYELIENLQVKAVTVSQACRTLEVSRSGYYAAAKRRSTPPVVCGASVHLKAAFAASGRTYGSRRLSTALHMSGVKIGRHRVRSLMRANALRPVWRRKFVHTTDSKHKAQIGHRTDRGNQTVLAVLTRTTSVALFVGLASGRISINSEY